MKSEIFVFLFSLLLAPMAAFAQVNEQSLYQQFLELMVDSQFLEYCHPIRPLPDFCRDNDGTFCTDLRERTFTSQAEFDHSEKYVMVEDSLPPLDLRSYAGFGHGPRQMPASDSLFLLRAFIRQAGRLSRVDTILNNGVRVASWNRFRASFPDLRHGKNRYFLNVGYFRFSRTLYDETVNQGVFSFLYLGGPECGYTGFCFFSRSASNWAFSRIYYTGDF